MATKTYLQLVNKVLLALRETQVTDLSASYSQLIGEFVNQAKEKVEDVWRWKALATNLTFTTVASQTTYQLALAGSPAVTSSSGNYPTERASILTDPENNAAVYDTTNTANGGFIRLRRETREVEFALNLFLATQAPIQPYAFSYVPASGTAFFNLVGAPLGGRTMLLHMKCPQDEFSIGTEIIAAPWRPVVSFATYLAFEERGEELGEQASIYQARHEAELQRAIEIDTLGEEGYLQLKNIETGGYGSLTSNLLLY